MVNGNSILFFINLAEDQECQTKFGRNLQKRISARSDTVMEYMGKSIYGIV
jgi:hypothetical protein